MKLEELKKLRNQLVIAGLAGIGALNVTGCSEKTADNKIVTEINTLHIADDSLVPIDVLLHFNGSADRGIKKSKVDYQYLIDNSEITDEEIERRNKLGASVSYASLAHVIDEAVITNRFALGDHKTGYTLRTFGDSPVQVITCPDTLSKKVIPLECADYEIDVKKLLSDDGHIFYSIKSTETFKKSANRYNPYVQNGDTVECEVLYQLVGTNKYVEIYRNQTGIFSEDENVVSKNINNETKILKPLEETVFKDLNGEYDKDYITEALDTYSGQDSFSAASNAEYDFSKFIKR